MSQIYTSSRNSQGELPAKNLRPALKLRTYNEEGRPSLISGMETVKLLGRYFVKMPLQDYYFRSPIRVTPIRKYLNSLRTRCFIWMVEMLL